MKKRILLIVIIGLFSTGIVCNFMKPEVKKNKNVLKENNSNMLSMMLETKLYSGEYQKAISSEWQKEGYLFNKELSKCENGSELTWDDNKKNIIMSGNVRDNCYIYFDKEPQVVKLSDYVKSQFTGKQGENNLYLHDKSLDNGANDGSYRYAGSSDKTNNFVCFGYESQDGSCPTDYLYRIIGVFGDEVKLIKYDYAKPTLLGIDGEYFNTYKNMAGSVYWGTNKAYNLQEEIGTYFWNNKKKNNNWLESELNTVNLNQNYLINIKDKWASKIALTEWSLGGNTWEKMGLVSVNQTYVNEIKFPASNKTYKSKIGLMYVSDYGYAASPSSWNIPLYEINANDYSMSSVTKVNWLYTGLTEWALTPRIEVDNNAYFVHLDGRVGIIGVDDHMFAVRPVFYLLKNTNCIINEGTISSPFIII